MPAQYNPLHPFDIHITKTAVMFETGIHIFSNARLISNSRNKPNDVEGIRRSAKGESSSQRTDMQTDMLSHLPPFQSDWEKFSCLPRSSLTA